MDRIEERGVGIGKREVKVYEGESSWGMGGWEDRKMGWGR